MSIVLYEERGPAAWITLNRPEKRNAITNDLLALVSEGIARAAASGARVIVLTGAGEKAFCAGGDLQPGGGFDFDFASPRTAYGNLLRQSQDCPLPIIAAVNGHCVAGGMGFLAMADMAIAVEEAKFGLPEVKIGLFPYQVLSLLKDLVPPRILREMCLTGALYDAEFAGAAGLLNRVVPRGGLMAAVEEMAAALATTSPTATRRGKYAMRALAAMDFDRAISFAEGQLGLATLTGDAREGLASFNEKRPTAFRGD
ncbi:enoyl-CoA hydratase [Haematobacter massiliensis]|uniref:Enoyl-CoA hydratase n=1 Tax=Haematobacter massiliensis TaxID=195105 RepID=A0A086Y2A6_9RHOB|nr:enoyl-CoA hydratase-related protein [Haematobacter massiliensis]KFI28406.1 enoyl-CoA hydratase [Haematobacter massiliensis]OWJ84653.1 enoyl-CoA hydratase [Haematobacter massiliensis]QBJ26382.1 enoyl-CoA hydratase/isomerase family protein [Haematobacter massiliensis]